MMCSISDIYIHKCSSTTPRLAWSVPWWTVLIAEVLWVWTAVPVLGSTPGYEVCRLDRAVEDGYVTHDSEVGGTVEALS